MELIQIILFTAIGLVIIGCALSLCGADRNDDEDFPG